MKKSIIFPAITSLATIFAISLGVNDKIVEASVTLISCLAAILLISLRRMRRLFDIELNADITNNFTLVLLYDSGEYDFCIQNLKKRYVNSQILVVSCKIGTTDQLESSLDPASGVILFLSDSIKHRAVPIFNSIEKWAVNHEARPIILVYSNDEQIFGDGMERLTRNFKKISLSQIEDSIYLLLAKAVSRSRLFIQYSKVWRTSFLATSLLSFGIIVFICCHYFFDKRHLYVEQSVGKSFNYIPTKSISEFNSILDKSRNVEFSREYDEKSRLLVRDFIRLYEMEIKHISHDESISLSYWRNFESKDSLHRISDAVKRGHTWLPLSDSSIAGCSCKFDNNFIGYKLNSHFIGEFSFWKDGTGEKIPTSSQKCFYFKNGNDSKKCIITHSLKLEQIGHYSVVSIDSDDSSNMIDDEELNDIIKKKLYELNNLLSLIPDCFFQY